MDKSVLFETKQLPSGLVIKNRFVKAAMNEAMGTKHLQPKKEVPDLYQQWARGGSGLVITGNVMVDANALAEPGNIVFDEHTDMHLLKQWASKGQEQDTKVIVQLNHPGKQSPKTISKHPVAPSAVPIEGNIQNLFNAPRELSRTEIKELITKFAIAADIAKQAGFSGVEIHTAHGYLLNQFLSPYDNRRTDEYGGSIENRMRFLKEIYLAMRHRVGKDYTIGLKINAADFKVGGFSEEDSIYVVTEMDNLGIDFVEVSGGSYENPRMNATMEDHRDTVFFASYSQKLKPLIKAPLIVTGGIRTEASMVRIIQDGIADFVGLARPLAIEPNLPRLVYDGHYKTIQTKRLTTGLKKIAQTLAPLLGLVYYQLLIQTWAKGKVPKVTTNAWPALIHAVYHQGLTALFPQRVK